jgi:SagB-type dehydrogenase family enzyme
MAPGDTARLYHRLSAFAPGPDGEWRVDDPRVLRSFELNRLDRFPAPCKSYPAGLPAVELPRRRPAAGASATAVLAGRHAAPPAAVDLPALARLLHLSAGVVRLAERPDGRRYRFRATGSAGGQFPYELYVASCGVDGLTDGVHWFDPLRHALVRVGPAPRGEATTVVISGIPWRTGSRYGERGFRHLYWDAGGVAANLLAVAEDAGLAPRLRTVFPDAAVTRLVGADGVQEFPLALVTFGDGAPAIAPGGDAARGAVDRRAPVEFPLVTAMQHAGDRAHLGAPWRFAAPLPGAPPDADPLDDVILRRISTRRMDPARSVDRDALAWSSAAALRAGHVPHFVAAHTVDGLAPGLYRWPALDAPTRAGDLREELFRVADEQELARDAAFVTVAGVDLATLDDRAYREAQFDAGLVSGRLQLAAFALGLGATGMTFVDATIPALLGDPYAGLLLTCVGVPSYRHRSGGPPGAPTRMRPLRAT